MVSDEITVTVLTVTLPRTIKTLTPDRGFGTAPPVNGTGFAALEPPIGVTVPGPLMVPP